MSVPVPSRSAAGTQEPTTRVDQLRTQVRARVAPFPLPLAALGALLVAIGSMTPWSTFTGYPGRMTLSGYPGGARLYTLLLLLAVPLIVTRVGGRRRAGLLAGLGILAISAYNVVNIALEGGGLVNVAYGAWLCVVGGALVALAFLGLPDDVEPSTFPRLPAVVEILAAVAAVFAVLVIVVWGLGLDNDETSLFISWLVLVGVAIAAVSAVGVLTWVQQLGHRHSMIMLGAAGIASIAFPFTQGGDAYWIRVFASIGVFAAAAIGLNIVVGLAGLLDLGYIAFFGIGAYVAGLLGGANLSTTTINLPFGAVLILGAVIAGVVGVVIGAPTLRLRGDYLAIVTLGFGEIFRISANNADEVTRGPNGIAGIPDLEILGYNFGETHTVFGVDLPGFANYFFLELVLIAVVILVFTRLNESRIGRAWVAIREDETAAAAMGINTIRLKLLAFGLGAVLAGAAGTVNAHVNSQVSPDSYTFLESVLLLAAVVLGGMGTVTGALLGSAVLFILPEKLRAFQDKRLLLFGLALILMMRFRPEGIAASERRAREFHDPGSGADATGAAPGGPVAPVTAGR